MKLILRLIGLKMSILRVDAAIINPKTVKPNLYPSRIIVGTDMEDERLVEAAHACHRGRKEECGKRGAN